MNPKFLSSIPVVVNAPLDDPSSGGISRRSFLKRTGGATLAGMIAWGTQENLRAEDDPAAEASDSGTNTSPPEYRITCTEPNKPIAQPIVLKTFNQGTYPLRIILSKVSAISTFTPNGSPKDKNVISMGGSDKNTYLELKLQSKNPNGSWTDVLDGTSSSAPEVYTAEVNTATGIISIDPKKHIGVPTSQSAKVKFDTITRSDTGSGKKTYKIEVEFIYSYDVTLPGITNNVVGSETYSKKTLHYIFSHIKE